MQELSLGFGPSIATPRGCSVAGRGSSKNTQLDCGLVFICGLTLSLWESHSPSVFKKRERPQLLSSRRMVAEVPVLQVWRNEIQNYPDRALSTEPNKTGTELSRAIPAAGTQGQVPIVWAGSTRTRTGKTFNLRDRSLVGMEGLFLDPRKGVRTECRTPMRLSPGERTSLETGAYLSTLPLLYRLQREPSALKPSLGEDKMPYFPPRKDFPGSLSRDLLKSLGRILLAPDFCLCGPRQGVSS